MEAMRHSDIRLTTKTYTDTGLLACLRYGREAPFFLPASAGKRLTNETHKICSATSPSVSVPVIKMTNAE